MEAISGNGETESLVTESLVLDLTSRLRNLGFTGENEGATILLQAFDLPAKTPVNDLNRWLQIKLAIVGMDLSIQEGSYEVEVTPEMTAATLGLALLTEEGTAEMIERLRRQLDV